VRHAYFLKLKKTNIHWEWTFRTPREDSTTTYLSFAY